jgi:hypothetical protein
MTLTLFIVQTSDKGEQYLCTEKGVVIQRGDFVKINSSIYNTTGVVSDVHIIDFLIVGQDGCAEFATYSWKYINRGYITIDRSSSNNTAKDSTEKLLDLTLISLRDSMLGTIKRFAIPYRVVKQGDLISISSDKISQ